MAYYAAYRTADRKVLPGAHRLLRLDESDPAEPQPFTDDEGHRYGWADVTDDSGGRYDRAGRVLERADRYLLATGSREGWNPMHGEFNAAGRPTRDAFADADEFARTIASEGLPIRMQAWSDTAGVVWTMVYLSRFGGELATPERP